MVAKLIFITGHPIILIAGLCVTTAEYAPLGLKTKLKQLKSGTPSWEREIAMLTKIDEYGNADIIGMEDETWQHGLSFGDMNRVTEALNKLNCFEQRQRQGCDFCLQGKPIKAHLIHKESGCQLGFSKKANYCPICGKRLEKE